MPFLPRDPAHHTEDVKALHRGTLEHPFDDTPHLVYADAMDDAGAHEEAATLRRLVALRSAIGSRPVGARQPHEPPLPRPWLEGTNTAGLREGDGAGRPFVRLPDVRLRRYGETAARPRAHATYHTDRRLYLVPETGGAEVHHTLSYREYEPRGRRHLTSTPTVSRKTFLHSDTVKALLGEDA